MLVEPKQVKSRAGFTLVELLAVIVIIGILSSIMLVALAGAAETARESRTRSQIQRIHELLMVRWESYRTRRVEPASGGSVRVRMGRRVDRLRDIMRMEMPNRRLDVSRRPVTNIADSALRKRYERKVFQLTGKSNWADALKDETNPADDGWSVINMQSECLYLILSSIQDGDTNGLEFLRENEIGDTDGDLMPEILDGWGKPIAFLRWAPGYVGSHSQLNDEFSPDPFDPLGVRAVPGDISKGHEKDPSTGKYRNFALYPLIFSAGRDQSYNVNSYLARTSDLQDFSEIVDTISPTTETFVTTVISNDPYTPTDLNGNRLGHSQGDEGYTDNITNHQLVVGGG